MLSVAGPHCVERQNGRCKMADVFDKIGEEEILSVAHVLKEVRTKD
jgi:hypothetical protein